MGKGGTKLGRGLRWILRERGSMSFSSCSFLKAFGISGLPFSSHDGGHFKPLSKVVRAPLKAVISRKGTAVSSDQPAGILLVY